MDRLIHRLESRRRQVREPEQRAVLQLLGDVCRYPFGQICNVSGEDWGLNIADIEPKLQVQDMDATLEHEGVDGLSLVFRTVNLHSPPQKVIE